MQLHPELETCSICGERPVVPPAANCSPCTQWLLTGCFPDPDEQDTQIPNAITLINCPACSTEVSNQAVSCPRCGHPLKEPTLTKASRPTTFIPLKRKSSVTAMPAILGLGVLGFVIGGGIGFLLRPAAPFIGQLPFEVVITQGSNLRGLDRMLVSIAQTSFAYMIGGAILGAISGAIIGALLAKKKA